MFHLCDRRMRRIISFTLASIIRLSPVLQRYSLCNLPICFSKVHYRNVPSFFFLFGRRCYLSTLFDCHQRYASGRCYIYLYNFCLCLFLNKFIVYLGYMAPWTYFIALWVIDRLIKNELIFSCAVMQKWHSLYIIQYLYCWSSEYCGTLWDGKVKKEHG